MTRAFARTPALAALLGGALMLQGCVAAAVVGVGAAVVGTGVKATGAVVGAGVDAVTTSDEERERAERRCEKRQRQGKSC